MTLPSRFSMLLECARIDEPAGPAWTVKIFRQGGGPVLRVRYGRGEAGKDRKSTRLNSSHIQKSRMPSSA